MREADGCLSIGHPAFLVRRPLGPYRTGIIIFSYLHSNTVAAPSPSPAQYSQGKSRVSPYLASTFLNSPSTQTPPYKVTTGQEAVRILIVAHKCRDLHLGARGELRTQRRNLSKTRTTTITKPRPPPMTLPTTCTGNQIVTATRNRRLTSSTFEKNISLGRRLAKWLRE